MATKTEEMFHKMKEAGYGLLKTTSNAFTPVLTESKFLAEGVLTPDEFVKAGDLLVYKCPTWFWAAGQPEKRVPYLPADKQFLQTRGVPCKTRFRDDSIKSESIDDDWLSVATQAHAEAAEEILDSEPPAYVPKPLEEENLEDIPSVSDFGSDNNIVEEDLATAKTNIQKNRTYDLAITYDKYERTPCMWLYGYSETQEPLKPEAIFMDISDDHAKKTVTLAAHPHLPSAWVYIHPCRHASVMKKFVQRMIEKSLEPRVDQYLLLFLKFMGAGIPTISYDNTFDIGI